MLYANRILYFNEQERRKFVEETLLFISTSAKEIQELNYKMEIIILKVHHNSGIMFYQQIISHLLNVLLLFLVFHTTYLTPLTFFFNRD
jgi:hypothetical protein